MAIHEMNESRRAAFGMMRRQALRFGGSSSMSTFWRDEVVNPGLARNLAKLGWLTILSGYRGRPSQIRLTEIGMWVLGGAS